MYLLQNTIFYFNNSNHLRLNIRNMDTVADLIVFKSLHNGVVDLRPDEDQTLALDRRVAEHVHFILVHQLTDHLQLVEGGRAHGVGGPPVGNGSINRVAD